MNKVILMGRLTRDPEVRYSQGDKPTAVARFTLAVNRTFKREGEPTADFLNCVAFGRGAEFIEKYFRQGNQVVVCGRIQTGSYINKDGQKIYTTNIVVDEQEFAQSKSDQAQNSPNGQQTQQQAPAAPTTSAGDGFMNIPDGIDEELPFD